MVDYLFLNFNKEQTLPFIVIKKSTKYFNNFKYFFKKSTVLLADLSTAVIRGCSTGNKPSDVESRLTGYQSQINFCNSTDYCNSAKRNNLSEVLLAVLIITTFFFY